MNLNFLSEYNSEVFKLDLMSMMYFILLPLFAVSLTKRLKIMKRAIDIGDPGRLKAAIFMLMLTLWVTAFIVFVINGGLFPE